MYMSQVFSLHFSPTHSLIFLFLAVNLFDITHLLTSYSYILSNPKIRKEKLRLLLIFFFAYMAIIYPLSHYLSSHIYLYFFGNLVMIHCMRQQYGWIRIVESKSNVPVKKFSMDQNLIYFYTIIPLIIGHMQPGRLGQGWTFKEDLFLGFLPDFSLPLSILYIVIAVIHFCWEGIELIKRKFSRLPFVLIHLTTFFAWGMGIIFSEQFWISNPMIILNHTIAYLYLTSVLTYKNISLSSKKTFIKENAKKITIAILLLLLSFALIRQTLEENIFPGEYFSILPELDISTSVYDNTFVWVLLGAPSILHFLIDGFLWRRKDGAVED